MTVSARPLAVTLMTLLLIGCAETSVMPSDPQVPSAKLELKAGTEFDIAVLTDITITDDKKQTKTYRQKRIVHAKVENGRAVAMSSRNAETSRLASMSTEEVLDDSLNFMPVLAVATGELTGSHDDYAYDDAGNVTLIQTGAPSADHPATMIKVHLNGVYQLTARMNWTAVSGGFLMSEQLQTTSNASGSQAQIRSTADFSTLQVTLQPSKTQTLLASAQSVLKQIACKLGPSVAYAATVDATGLNTSASMMSGCLGERRGLPAAPSCLGSPALKFRYLPLQDK